MKPGGRSSDSASRWLNTVITVSALQLPSTYTSTWLFYYVSHLKLDLIERNAQQAACCWAFGATVRLLLLSVPVAVLFPRCLVTLYSI